MTATTATPAATREVQSSSDYVAPRLWGKDHWSTLAYIESVMTDCGGFEMGLDPRMRSNRRNYRVMNEVPLPKRTRKASTRHYGAPLGPGDGSVLSDGQCVTGHDDWNCLEDMASVGFFNIGILGLAPGKVLKFSPLGLAVSSRLRQHKQDGGNFAEFSIAMVPEATSEALVPPAEEYFTWAGMSFDIGALLADIGSGVLKPKAETLDREFIEGYAKSVMALDKTQPEKKTCSIWVGVDGQRANAMPMALLEKPVIIAYVGKNKGLLNLDNTGGHYVLIDGNHRMGKAYFADAANMPVFILSQAQIRKYKG